MGSCDIWCKAANTRIIAVCLCCIITITVLRPLNYSIFQVTDVKESVDFLAMFIANKMLKYGYFLDFMTEAEFKLHLLKNYFYNQF